MKSNPVSLEETNSLFQQPWWLEAVAPGQWDSVEVRHQNKVRARWPFMIKRGFGNLRYLAMPPLTQTLGPWIAPGTGKYAKRIHKYNKLLSELVSKLPRFDVFRQNFHNSITNWLPLYWSGFSQTTLYTYVFDDLSNLETLWNGFQQNVRWEISKAEKILRVNQDLAIEKFWKINNKTFERQNITPPYSRETVYNLHKACLKHDACRIFSAHDRDGKIHAALYLVWDNRCAYYLMGGGDPDLRRSGATSLLIWKALQFASTVTQKFDFEGSMIPSIERFFRAFGPQQVPYFKIIKRSRCARFMNSLRNAFKAIVAR